MAYTYWRKQTPDNPLSPDLLWSRPETKRTAGKLLILGGSEHGFKAPAEAFAAAQAAGIGTTRAMLPDHVAKLLPVVPPGMEFVPSTPSGSFARQSLAELLDAAAWADGVLLAGDFGKNSETAIVLESLITKFNGPLVIRGDTLDLLLGQAEQLAARERTVIVPTLAQLQKFASAIKSTQAITSSLDFLHFIEALHSLTEKRAINIVIDHLETTFVANQGGIISTKPPRHHGSALAARSAVWTLQNPGQIKNALACAVVSD